MKDKIIVAVNIVIIDKYKKVLIAKRPEGKAMPNKWEFPGGKLEDNETLQKCGVREIQEELELDVKIDKYLGFEDLSYKDKKFCLHFYTAYKVDEYQMLKLNVHTDYAWVNISDLAEYDLPAIDLPSIKRLESIF